MFTAVYTVLFESGHEICVGVGDAGAVVVVDVDVLEVVEMVDVEDVVAVEVTNLAPQIPAFDTPAPSVDLR